MKSKNQRYTENKDSGIGWLGEIPKHWELKRLKFIAEIRGGVAKGRDLSGKPTIKLPYLRVANVQDNYLSLDEISSLEIQPNEEARYSLKSGDILMTEGGDNDKLGRGTVWLGQIPRCLHQNHVFAVRPFDAVNSYWINWMTQTEYLRYFFLIRSKQTTNLASISSTNLKETPVIFPPLHERLVIAHYLDTKTAQIDRKIDLLTQKATLYSNLKQSLINETVTRGLDKTAPMKNSGIELLGEVPKHWECELIKRSLRVLTDYTANGSFASLAENVTYQESGYARLVRLTDLRHDLKNEGLYVDKNAYEFLSKTKISGGEILIANVGAYTGLVKLVPEIDFKATLGPNMFLAIFNSRLLQKFISYQLSSICCFEQFRVQMTASAQPKLNKDNFRSISIAIPPLSEQRAISDYLDTKTAKIHQIIQTINTQIEKLKELRKTLINDVVTGKIKVV